MALTTLYNLNEQRLDTIENPVTGDSEAQPARRDRMTVLHSVHTHDGAYAKFQFGLPPGAKGSPLHYHTHMSETFTVLKGCLEMEVAQKGNYQMLHAGERLEVPSGMPHSFRNASNERVYLSVKIDLLPGLSSLFVVCLGWRATAR